MTSNNDLLSYSPNTSPTPCPFRSYTSPTRPTPCSLSGPTPSLPNLPPALSQVLRLSYQTYPLLSLRSYTYPTVFLELNQLFLSVGLYM